MTMRKRLALLTVSTMVSTLGVGFVGAAPASADGVTDALTIINDIAGTRTCSVSATTPTKVGATIRGTGAVACSPNAYQLALQVCIETSPTGALDSWAEAGCGTPQVRSQSGGYPGNATAQCPPNAAYYRTRSVASAVSSSGQPRYMGTVYSNSFITGCNS